MKKIVLLFSFLISWGGATAHAVDFGIAPPPVIDSPDFVSVDELLYIEPSDTKCATAAFADALAKYDENINEQSTEIEVKTWINTVFSRADVLNQVLACPEIANIPEGDTIKLLPIEYTFPDGRKITINYETQPKIFKQRQALANRHNLPSGGPNPRIGPDDDAVWTNTDPAWYAIMVVRAGALDEFVGPKKNNTLSLKYLEEHIDNIWPEGTCTNKTAFANDNRELNVAVTRTVGLKDRGEEDSNDYYVAGDRDLRWIGYVEIGLDIAITVLTVGGSQAVTGSAKAARASKSLKGMVGSLKSLRQVDSVSDYVRLTGRVTNLTNDIKKLDKVADAAEIAKKTDQITDLTKQMRNLENIDDNVKTYAEMAKTYSELNKYRHALKGIRLAKTGNVLTRTYRAFKAVNSGGKLLNRGARIARSSTLSGRVRDWLFHSTMRNTATLGKMVAAGGVLYTAVNVLGDMYDLTDTSTGEFTNGIEFKPLGLLSADDIKGQEDVVNYGMWLMWMGDSVDAADDDAAYLQAMDFAAKFHEDLLEVQKERGSHDCDIDIYIVRPILRNPGSDNPEMYYLIMNDKPWTTADK